METYPLSSKSKIDHLLKTAEFNRFGLIFVILTIVGCLGGVTIGLGAINNTFTLIAVVLPSMLTLSLLLALAPMRIILTTAFIAVSIDVLLMLYFLFV